MNRKKSSTYLLLIWALASGVKTRSQYQRAGTESTRDRVLLDDVKVVTLYKSRLTAGRRSAPLPQLECQGGCRYATLNMVQCYNMGSDGIDAAWKCEASMPEGYDFTSIEVGCEGYDYPEDPYILKDSCQLIYSLGVPRYEHGWSRGSGGRTSDFASRLVTWTALGIIGYVLYHVFRGGNSDDATRPHPPPPVSNDGWGWGGGGGGGGGGGNWRGSGPNDSYTKNTSTTAPAPAAGNGWMSTLAAGGIGAALGYMLRPRQPRYAAGGFNMNRSYRRGTFGGAETYRGQTGGRSGGGGGGMMRRAGYGGTTRR